MKNALNIIVLLFFLLVSTTLYSLDEDNESIVSVLFIGNSLTYYNNLPGMLENLAIQNNNSILVDRKTVPGASLLALLNNQSVIDKINEKTWDYIILQSNDITAFPDMYHYEINTLTSFKNIITNNCENTKIIYPMLWGFRNGIYVPGDEVFYTYEEYFEKIYVGTLYIADQLDLLIAPIGLAWKQVREENPAIELFAADNCHPALKGSYIGACVYFSVIFQESSVGLNYYNSIPESEALLMQNISSNVVLDSLDLWNIESDLGLYQNFNKSHQIFSKNTPNPFNPSTTICYDLPKTGNVKIEIYNLLGKKIKTLFNGLEEAGQNKKVVWDGTDEKNNYVASSIYFYKITIENESIIEKMLLMK